VAAQRQSAGVAVFLVVGTESGLLMLIGADDQEEGDARALSLWPHSAALIVEGYQ